MSANADRSALVIPRGDRIRTARDLRALTQREAAGRLTHPITPAALSQIESGKTRPTAETLRDLAEALSVPVEYFGIDWPRGSGPEILERVTYFRDLASTPSRQRRRAAALAGLLNDLVAAIELRVQLPRVSVPTFPVASMSDDDEIEANAEALRGEWDLGAGPVPDVVRLIENHGVPVAQLWLGVRTVDAFSVRFASRPLILLAADKSNYVRSRFDAAHELGHLIMHRHADGYDRSIEPQAHKFASAFLMPREAALEELPRRIDRSTWPRLADLKREWGMSLQALLMRSRMLGLLSTDAHRSAMKVMSARGWRAEEPGDRQMGPAEAARLFERAFRTIRSETGESVEAVIDSANLPVDDCLQLIQASGDRRPQLLN